MVEMTGRILGIDYGEKRIGLALSDPLGITAQPLETLHRTRIKEDLNHLKNLIRDHDVTRIVIGLPLNMNGSEGFMVDSTRAFSKELQEATSVEIIEIDERLTSHQAMQALDTASVKGRKKKKNIDAISAQIILQTYMNSMPS